MREDPYDPSILDDWSSSEIDPSLPEEIVERIRDTVEMLPEPQRSVVECLVWGRERKVEVAERLGLSRSHIHRLWVEARRILADALADLQ